MDTLIRIGSRGEEVIKLQEELNNWGFPVETVDGIFGPETRAAVIRFQKYHNLKPDGIIGPKTNEVLWTPRSRNSTDRELLVAAIRELGRIQLKENPTNTLGIQPPIIVELRETFRSLIDIITYTGTNNDVLEIAIDVLGNIQSEEAVQPLINIITDTDTDSSVRLLAICVLKNIKSKEAIQPLINIITNTDRDRDVRYSAIHTLNNIHSPDGRFDGQGSGNDWRRIIVDRIKNRG